MPANRDKKTGKWNCQFYYTDWTGKKVKKMKRGFETKKEAEIYIASEYGLTLEEYRREKKR